jgi:hypothetical protein
MSEPITVRRELRTPRAAAVAGLAFSLILGAVIVLLHSAAASVGRDPTDWISSDSRRHSVGLALTLVPFAGIAFLWFIGVIRSRLGEREDRFFATVLLGSGLLFVAMLFSASAVLGSLLVVYDGPNGASDDTIRLAGALTSTLLATFGARMAAVFTLVVTTVGHRMGLTPRWLTVVGYVSAVALLLMPPGIRWVQLVFPAWVLLLSLDILVRSLRPSDPT